MSNRQAVFSSLFLFSLLFGLSACSSQNQVSPTSDPNSTTITFNLPQNTPLPPTETPIPISTPLTCLLGPGRVESVSLNSTNPPQEFFIYLPPCYDEKQEEQYPVIYLLHGQTYTADQWLRIGAVNALETLIHSGETRPFIIVFPDDRYWNLPPSAGFGDRLVDVIVPYVDSNYRTLPDRNHRAVGGMSRGAGWALRMGLTRWDLFSVIGLHSLAVLQTDRSQIDDWIAAIPPDSYPSVFMDIGDNDQEYNMALSVEGQFTENGLTHEWHRYTGAHTEEYWSAHVMEYITWYAEQWNQN